MGTSAAKRARRAAARAAKRERREAPPAPVLAEVEVPPFVAKAPPSNDQLMGLALVANTQLLPCPRWQAGLDVKTREIKVELADLFWPFTHFSPICPRCGRVVGDKPSPDLECAAMLTPQVAMNVLIVSRAPAEVLHGEA